MKKGIIGLIAVIVIIVAVAGVCVLALSPAPAPTKKVKVAIVMSSPVADMGWNAMAYEGLLYIEKNLGVETAYSESVSDADQERVIRDYAAAGYNLIIGHGFQFQNALFAVAKDYPNTAFAWADGYETAHNLAVYAVLAHESGYLAGMLAAGMSKTGIIGAHGGEPVPDVVRIIEGYKLGAKAVNPDIRVLTTYLGTWIDTGKAKEATLAMIDSGADIISHNSGGASFGGIEACKERGIYQIGDTADQHELAPDTMLTSVLMYHATPIIAMTEDLINGEFGGKFYTYSLVDGGSDIAPYYDLESVIPADLRATIKQAKDDIISGALIVPNIEEPTD